MPPGKKNKRGDRGSSEESYENSAAKRHNMADNDAVETKNDDTSSSEQNEPDLHEIKAMLVDIQISLCLLYTSPSPRDQRGSRMPSSA